MNTTRALLGIIGGASAGYAITSLFYLTITDFGVSVAISAGCVLGIFLIRAIQADQKADRRRMAAYRDQVWQRRIQESHRPDLRKAS